MDSGSRHWSDQNPKDNRLVCRSPDALFETQPKKNPPGLIPTGPLTRYFFREGPICGYPPYLPYLPYLMVPETRALRFPFLLSTVTVTVTGLG
jgi:hypothetical protein